MPWYAMELLDSRSLDELLDIAPPEQTPTEAVLPFQPRSGVLVLPPSERERPHVRGDLLRALTR